MGKWRYGVILDAGSSGTRIHIYKWLDANSARQDASAIVLSSLPVIQTKDEWTKKSKPGVSSFAETPTLIGHDHLEPLLHHALKHIPSDDVKDTPLFLLGTAGMRLLPDTKRDGLLQQICDYIRSSTEFALPDCDLHIQVIPGDTEGLYGWIAANYLLGGFDSPERHDHGKGHHTYGFLDMGGASAQIAFAPNATEAVKHSNDLTLLRLRTLNGLASEYQVFVTTWLRFGVNEARKRYVDALVAAVGDPSVTELPDPCLPADLQMTLGGKIIADIDSIPADEQYLLGTGNFEECLRQSYPLLNKDTPCKDEPCLLNGVHVPAIDFDVNHFIGISEYWHTTHEIFGMGHKDRAYDFNTYQTRVQDFCNQDWSIIQTGLSDKIWGKKVDEHTTSEVCFKASWLINVLHQGIGVPRISIENNTTSSHNGTKEVLQQGAEKDFLDPFQAVSKIKSTEVSWTLGKMVLYAASQVPPAEEDLPVGFGANEPGVLPDSWQYPGGSDLPTISKLPHDIDDSFTDRLHDTLFSSDSPRRLPGFILFILIVFIATFFACGRDRRSRIYRNFFSGEKRTMFGRKVPFLSRSSGPRYERIETDGDGLEHPDDFDFELTDADWDDTEAARGVKSPPWSSPRGKVAPVTLSPDLMDRHGLVIRTESAERLDLQSGKKSRSGSPTRLKGHMPALSEGRAYE